MAGDFTVNGADQFLRLSKALKVAGRTELRKELNKELRKAGRPLIAKTREAARSELPQHGGLAAQVAKEPQRVQVRTGQTTAGVRIVVGRKRGGAWSTNRGVVRHPVFADGGKTRGDWAWVNQKVNAGWFDNTLRNSAPTVRPAIEAALESIAEKVVRGRSKMASLALAFDILARDKGASQTFDKVGRSAENAGKRGKGFGSAMKSAVGVAAGALAAVGLADLIGSVTGAIQDSIGEAREAQKVGATTGQIIKATGGAAKVSQKQVEGLAESISNKVGVDDEAIQSGANLLLTFKKVRNEVGKGNDIFNRATQAATDLSAAGFGSIESGSKMLGKALQDPVKGITALSRAGVTFTDQQKKQIKTFVASGKTLEAQKLILGEVESQVGGVAAASATMGEKVRVSFDNLKERLGTALLPVLDKLGLGLLGLMDGFTNGEVSTDGFVGKMMQLGKWVKTSVIPAIKSLWGWISGSLWPALQEGWKTILPGLQKALAIVSGGVGDNQFTWKSLGDVITTKVIPFMSRLISVTLPMLAIEIRRAMDTVKLLWAAFKVGMSIVGSVATFILKRFSEVASVWAGLLRALGKVPGFEWATDAANKLDRAASKARDVARAIDNIKTNIKVNVDIYARTRQTGRIELPGGKAVNVGLRAHGGPVRRGQPYIVGEREPELFVPSQSGRIMNQRQIAAASAAAPAGSAGGGLSQADIMRLAGAMAQVQLSTTVSGGSVERAIGAGLR